MYYTPPNLQGKHYADYDFASMERENWSCYVIDLRLIHSEKYRKLTAVAYSFL